MRGCLFSTVLVISALLVVGCSTPAPEPKVTPIGAVETPSAVQSTRLEEMLRQAAMITEAGGLAVVGTAESKNLDLAMNKAKVNGYKELARILNHRVEALAKAFSDETGIQYDSLHLSGFNHTAQVIGQQLVGCVAQTLNYEVTGETFTAYAIMALDPTVIAEQLARETDLYSRLKTTQTFEKLQQDVKTYGAFKAVK